MNYTGINERHVKYFNQLLDNNNVLFGTECNSYARDHTENLIFVPELVLFPTSTQDVVNILKYCNKNHISITPSAALTGLSGGALPIYGGVSLSMKKMNKLISIDKDNFQATVEPGLINEEFQIILEKQNLFYPPDPASKGSCTLGGNFALNAGGPKAIKYGVTSNYVLNLEIVLPNGDVFWTGANTLKNATGYNLTQLMIGSEGTLGVITKAVVKILSLPSERLLILIPFNNNLEACRAVSDIMCNGILPSSLEFMEKDAVLFVRDQNYADLPFKIEEKTESYLLIELDGSNKEQLFNEAEKIYTLIQKYACGKVIVADNKTEQERIWKVRRSIGLAVKAFSVYKEEDTVVPRANLVKLLEGVKLIGATYNFKSICYGHAGDGNLHVNILKDGLTHYQWDVVLNKAIREIFELCVKLGGTISGEHGIGFIQKKFIDIPFCDSNLELQKKIKQIFDPNNILNPGKIFDI